MYKALVLLLRVLIGWKVKVKVEGQDNLPTNGPVLVIFNHNDFLDTIAILFSLPRKLTAFVASNYRNNPVVLLFRMVGSVILVNRGRTDKSAMKQGLKLLNNGGFLAVAPEGTRGQTAGLGTGKYGAAYLAGTIGCLIVPVGIEGTTAGFKRVLGGLLTRDKIVVNVRVGLPFYLTVPEELKNSNLAEPGVKDSWQLITNVQMMPAIARLLPEDLRGNFS